MTLSKAACRGPGRRGYLDQGKAFAGGRRKVLIWANHGELMTPKAWLSSDERGLRRLTMVQGQM